MKTFAEPQFTVPVSPKEKKMAEVLRAKFEELLKELEEFDRFLLVFFDRIDDLKEETNLKTLGPLIVRYEYKLKEKFNSFMEKMELALGSYRTGFADTQLDNIRDLIIESTKSVRSALIELIKLFKKVDDPEFIMDAKNKYATISETIGQMNVLIKDELFKHIDYDILGRIRLGIREAPLVIRG